VFFVRNVNKSSFLKKIRFFWVLPRNTASKQCTYNTPFCLLTSLTLELQASAQLQDSELKQGNVLCDVIYWHMACGTVSVVAVCSETVGLAPS